MFPNPNELPPEIEKLIQQLRADPMAQEDVRHAMKTLVPPISAKRLHRALKKVQLAADNDDFASAMDAVLEVVPPGDDWIWLADEEKWRPGLESVVKRALSCGLIFWRAIEEYEKPSAEDRAFIKEISDWALCNLADELTEDEVSAFRRAPGKWSRDAAFEQTNAAYSFELLGWALQLCPVAAFDESIDGSKILEHVQALRQRVREPCLRPLEELKARTDEASIWRKRASLHSGGNRANISGLLRRLGWQFSPDSQEASHGDLLAFGKPFWSLDNGEFQFVSTVAHHRYLAGTWLCGGYPSWDTDR